MIVALPQGNGAQACQVSPHALLLILQGLDAVIHTEVQMEGDDTRRPPRPQNGRMGQDDAVDLLCERYVIILYLIPRLELAVQDLCSRVMPPYLARNLTSLLLE